MELNELKKRVDGALKDCQDLIKKNPCVIRSEADFEKYLSLFISERIGFVPRNPIKGNFSVHSQITHYEEENGNIDARVDILLFKEDDTIETNDLNKMFICAGKTMAIELKYLHTNNYHGIVQKDFDKEDKICKDSWLYIVVLLDNNNQSAFLRRKSEIISMWKNKVTNKKCKGKLFCKVLEKKI